MKLTNVRTVLTAAQENESHGNIFTTSGHAVSFDFYTYEGNDSGDIIGYNTDTEAVSILSAGCNSYIDCDHITHIEVFPHKD